MKSFLHAFWQDVKESVLVGSAILFIAGFAAVAIFYMGIKSQ